MRHFYGFFQNLNFKIFSKFEIPNMLFGTLRVLSGVTSLASNATAQMLLVSKMCRFYVILKFFKELKMKIYWFFQNLN